MSATPAVAPPRNRRRTEQVILAIGVILMIIAFIAAAGLGALGSFNQTTGAKVVVAATDIGARSAIGGTQIKLMTVTPAPPDAFTSLAAVQGQFALITIGANTPITHSMVAAAATSEQQQSTPDIALPSGFVAVTLPTSEEQAVAGYIKAGDRILIMSSLNTQVFNQQPGKNVVKTVFHDVLILRTGVGSVPGGLLGSNTAGQTVPSSITVAVTPCDAEYLYWLRNNSALKYALESVQDASSALKADPACSSITSGTGVGPTQVDSRYNFTK